MLSSSESMQQVVIVDGQCVVNEMMLLGVKPRWICSIFTARFCDETGSVTSAQVSGIMRTFGQNPSNAEIQVI